VRQGTIREAGGGEGEGGGGEQDGLVGRGRAVTVFVNDWEKLRLVEE